MSASDGQIHDVFLSYAREDAARAQFICDQLEALGLSVFFDTEGIDSGEEFPIIIDRAVKGAKCVLGLWSRAALAKRWVRIESRIGLDQKKLVAAVIDGTRPEDLPAEFYNVDIEDLSDFDGGRHHPGWARILRSIGRRVGRNDLAAIATTARPASGARTAGPPPAMVRLPPLVWIGAGAIVAGVAFFLLRPDGGADVLTSAPKQPAVVQQPATQKSAAGATATTDDHEAAQREMMRLEQMRLWGACEADKLTACRAYVTQFPAGAFVQRASAKIRELERPPAAADLSGEWNGYYSGGGNQRTLFAVTISGAPGRFRGRMAEQNTFADRSVARLHAEIAGETRADGRVVFVKTYDGTGSASHSVQYEGRIDESGRAISGEWSIGSTRGQFQMVRR
jgi:hypothetical protein